MTRINRKFCATLMIFGILFSYNANSTTRIFATMDADIIRSSQSKSTSAEGNVSKDGIGGGGSSETTGEGAVLGVWFECIFHLFDTCETDDQQYISVDGDVVKMD